MLFSKRMGACVSMCVCVGGASVNFKLESLQDLCCLGDSVQLSLILKV